MPARREGLSQLQSVLLDVYSLVILPVLNADSGPVFDADKARVDDAPRHQNQYQVTECFECTMHKHLLSLDQTVPMSKRFDPARQCAPSSLRAALLSVRQRTLRQGGRQAALAFANLRYAIKSPRSRASGTPSYVILLPGTSASGLTKNRLSVFSSHTMPDFFMAGE